jgi:hypothetical protein
MQATYPRERLHHPCYSWPWRRWEAAAPHSWLSRPDLPRAKTRTGVGRLVWPQQPLVRQRVRPIAVWFPAQRRLAERVVIPPGKQADAQEGIQCHTKV